jgi:hypothetical protein
MSIFPYLYLNSKNNKEWVLSKQTSILILHNMAENTAKTKTVTQLH